MPKRVFQLFEQSSAHSAEMLIDPCHGVAAQTISDRQIRFLTWTVDLLIYVVILNLFTEFAPEHIAFDTFWVTLFVAVLFRILLASMDHVKGMLKAALKERGRPILATLGVLPIFAIGKLVILEVVDSLFRQVSLNGFWYEWFLIFFLIVIPAMLWEVFDRLR